MIIIREPHQANRPPYLWSYDPDEGTITLKYDPIDGQQHLGLVLPIRNVLYRESVQATMYMSPEAEEWLPEQ